MFVTTLLASLLLPTGLLGHQPASTAPAAWAWTWASLLASLTPACWLIYLSAVWVEAWDRLGGRGGGGQALYGRRFRIVRAGGVQVEGGGGEAQAAPPCPDEGARLRSLLAVLKAQPQPERVFWAESCVVCLEGLAGAEAEAGAGAGVDPGSRDCHPLVLRCGHVFHAQCIGECLLSSARCPVCREVAVGGRRLVNVLF